MNELLRGMEGSGEGLIGWVLWMNVWCAMIAAAALVVDRALAQRIAPIWRMLLYAAVFIRLVLPVSFATPIGVAPESTSAVRILLNSGELAATATTTMNGNAGASLQSAERSAPSWSAAALAVPVYFGGVAVLCAAWFIGAARLHRIAARSSETGLDAAGVPVLRHPSAGPILIGLLRPRLVIPADLETRAGSGGLEWVLRHESAHVLRRDPFVAAILHAVVIAAWPVMAAWIAAARIRGLMEEACDARALRGAAEAERADYGRTLIELASARTPVRLAPALPFGASLRSRIRALTFTTRWPAAAQGALALVIALGVVACTGSRKQDAMQQRGEVQVENAETEPFKGSLPIRVTILRSWPSHPKLNFALGQVRAGAPEPDWSIDRILTPEEFAEILNGAIAADPDAVLSRPRLEVIPGGKATVSVGVQHRDGQPTEGFTLDSTVTLVEIPAGAGGRRTFTMDLDFRRFGDETVATGASVRGVKVPEGQTIALLSTGRIGAERQLVCISPGRDRIATAFDQQGQPQPLIAQPPALIDYTVRIHRVDAPRDYGSPKGDGPRKKWSAIPGGQAMMPKEFASYLEELRRRPGYALVSAPRVTALPDQEATIEVRPEAEDPDALHTIRLRGTPDGEFVRFTGSYSRSAGGTTEEGSWNQSRPMAPDSAMVWSIHDPAHGAWYTVTIQARALAQSDIKPQTAGGLAPEAR